MKKLLATLLLSITCTANAVDFDIDQLMHKTNLIYLIDQSEAGARAYGFYSNFSAISYDGSSHDYLRKKYKPNHPDVQIGFATQLSDNLAITYIFGTGSKSEKFEVQKSLKLGFTYLFGIQNYSPKTISDTYGYSYFTVGASHIFGGRSIEKGCTDDYQRQYNCRSALAVTDHPLISEAPRNQNSFNIKFTLVKDFF